MLWFIHFHFCTICECINTTHYKNIPSCWWTFNLVHSLVYYKQCPAFSWCTNACTSPWDKCVGFQMLGYWKCMLWTLLGHANYFHQKAFKSSCSPKCLSIDGEPSCPPLHNNVQMKKKKQLGRSFLCLGIKTLFLPCPLRKGLMLSSRNCWSSLMMDLLRVKPGQQSFPPGFHLQLHEWRTFIRSTGMWNDKTLVP